MTDPVRDTRPVESPVQTCPRLHWFELTVRLKPETQRRPEWWPVERLPGFAGAAVSITLAGVAPPLQALDSSSRLRADGLASAGTATLLLYDFCTPIAQAIERDSTYHPR